MSASPSKPKLLGPYRPGDCVFRIEPYAAVAPAEERLTLCDRCLGNGDKKCGSCKAVSYCSRECQRVAWRQFHKLECRCLVNHSPRVPSESGRLFLKLLARRLVGDDPDGSTWRDAAGLRSFNELVGHEAEILSDESRMSAFHRLVQSVRHFTDGVIATQELPSSEVLLGMFGRQLVNAFSVQDSCGRRVGTALCLSAAAFNHSCMPNLHAYMHGGQLVAKCLATADSLDALRINYCSPLEPWRVRDATLRSQYYFNCRCDMCLTESHAPEIDEVKCSREDCVGVCRIAESPQPSTSSQHLCDRCSSAPVCADPASIRTWRCRLLATAGSPQQAKPLLSDPGNPLHPMHRACLQLWEAAYADSLASRDWLAAQRIGETVLLPARELHLRSHRRESPWLQHDSGLLHLELGKLASYQMQLRRALAHFEQAEAILRLTLEPDTTALALLAHLMAKTKTEILAVEQESDDLQ